MTDETAKPGSPEWWQTHGPSPGDAEWWERHGISETVRDERPYVRYTAEDLEPVREEYSGLPQKPQRSFMTRVATDGLWWASKDEAERLKQKTWLRGKCDGWLIKRHPPPDLGLDPIYAELRPDADEVRTDREVWEAHPDDASKPLICPDGSPWPGEPLPDWRVLDAEKMRRCGHIARSKAPDDHHDVNTDEVHSHLPAGKYIFPPRPKKDSHQDHDHSEDYSTKPKERHKTDSAKRRFAERQRQRRAGHLISKRSVPKTRHGGKDVVGRHRHTYRVPVETVNYAARLDAHRLALPLLKDAEIVFLVIEGCIKGDAVLTAILETGEKATVVSVPSVTLCGTPYHDLELFARRHLRDKHTAIIPDMDWTYKPEVFTQAMLVRSYLRNGIRNLRLSAHVAAPPESAGYKGVDDFLGSGGKLTDLDVIDREPGPGIDKWAGSLPASSWANGVRRKTIVDAILMMRELSIHAGVREKEGEGQLFRSLSAYARIFRVSKEEARRRQLELVDLGAIKITKGGLDLLEEIETDDGDVIPPGRWYGDQRVAGVDYVDRPMIEIREDLRAGELTHKPLRKARQDWTIPSNSLLDQWVSLANRHAELPKPQKTEAVRLISGVKTGTYPTPHMLGKELGGGRPSTLFVVTASALAHYPDVETWNKLEKNLFSL